MTKKKTLLKEGTVRQFMKLANIEPLTPGFVEKLYEGEEVQEEEVQEEEVQEEGTKKDHELNDTEDDGARGEKKGDEAYVNEQEEVEVEDEVELGGEEVLGGEEEEEVDVTALVRAIADAVEAHTGVSVDVADEDAGEEVELGAEEEVELGDGEEVELGAEEEVEELEESEEVQEETQDLEEIISTIAENVTKRLEDMAKKKIKMHEGPWDTWSNAIDMGLGGGGGKEFEKQDYAAKVAHGMAQRAKRLPSEDPALSRKKHAARKKRGEKSKRARTGYEDITTAIKAHPNAPEGFGGGQKDVDELASALGLRAGKDFRNYPQMKKAVLKALDGTPKAPEKKLPGNKRPGGPRKVIQPRRLTMRDVS